MIDAAVGIHCPVCAGRMRENAMSEAAYRARTQLERTTVGRRLGTATATGALIVLNVGIFVAMLFTGRPTSGRTLLRFGALFDPLPRDEWWRLFTSMFVHIGIAHLLFNMFALTLFGRAIEVRHGKARFILLYLASGLSGAAASLAFTQGGIRAGASGGVFGILGAWIAFYLPYRHMRGARQQLQSLLFLVGINLFFGFTVRGIDNGAHLGGLVAGFLIGSGLELARRATRPMPAAAPLGFASVVLAAVLLILPNTV